MKKLITICLAATIILAIGNVAIGSVANADWNPGDPAKWVQLPDLNPTGIDVLATHPKVLADDFLCTQTGPITDIHIWGSWLNDCLPLNSEGLADPTQVGFRLSIHSDIPKDQTGSYSMPGESSWQMVFNPGEFAVNLYADNLTEGWYNPNTEEYIPLGDTQVWQYNFFIDPLKAFEQQGSETDPIVYWLDVEAFPIFEPGTQEPLFGWKTSLDHWNDDAVWGDTPSCPWNELQYPQGHPFAGQMDLAFVITPEPATICLLAIGSLVFMGRKR